MKLFPSLVLPVALFALVMTTSCTQEYTCQCTIRYSGGPGLPDSTINEYPITDTKKKAKSACEAKSATYTTGSVTATETCRLY